MAGESAIGFEGVDELSGTSGTIETEVGDEGVWGSGVKLARQGWSEVV